MAASRPALPAPTDLSSTDTTSNLYSNEEIATNISLRTDKTHYTIPEDGTPVTITTKKSKDPKKQSSTSLLIEYFEGSKEGRSPTSRPSLRVRVTPSASRKSKHGRDHIQISETNRSGRRSAVRRISLPGAEHETERTEITSGSDLSSNRAPVDVEVLRDHSEGSELGAQSNVSRYVVPPSDISSMPPDSFLDGPGADFTKKTELSASDQRARDVEHDILVVPDSGRHDSASKERIAQRVIERLQKDPGVKIRESSRRRRTSVGSYRSNQSPNNAKDVSIENVRSSKRGHGSSLQPSEISGVSSKSSSSINNPRLINAVEDAIKKLILPELKAVKDEQRALSKRHKHSEHSRTTAASHSDDMRRVSKASSLSSVRSSANLTTEELVTLKESRSGHRHSSSRKSSRESVSDKSYETTRRTSHGRRRSSGEQKTSREGASHLLSSALPAAALAGLSVAAVKHQSSHGALDKQRSRRRSRSRSRSSSGRKGERHQLRTETLAHLAHDVPPLPMQSVMESELTRDSLLSTNTERPSHPPGNVVLSHERTVESPGTEHRSSIRRSRDSNKHALHHHVATGLGAAAAAATMASLQRKHSREHLLRSSHDQMSICSESSVSVAPVHSEIQLPVVGSRTGLHSGSLERSTREFESGGLSQQTSEPVKKLAASNEDVAYEILPDEDYESSSAQGDKLERWLESEYRHKSDDSHRSIADSLDSTNLVTADRSILTTGMAEMQHEGELLSHDKIGAMGPKVVYVHTPAAVESAVASLQEPSTISVRSSDTSSPRKLAFEGPNVAFAQALPQGRAFDSRRRWEAIRDQAMAMTNPLDSPAQSETRSLNEQPVLGAIYVPSGDIPEFGVMPDDESDLITNPSIISGHLDGTARLVSFNGDAELEHQTQLLNREVLVTSTARPGVPIDTSLQRGPAEVHTPQSRKQDMFMMRQSADPIVEEAYVKPLRSTDSPLHYKDEGYISANPALSPAILPVPLGMARGLDLASTDILEEDDPFISERHLKHESGLSHGMSSPLYDSATGKGIDRIQSKDVVALMNHLTARDALRNARDSEILMTLVHSAAEMRNNFEEMKLYIAEQDRLLLHNMDRANEVTVKKVFSGPRPQPLGSPRTPRRQASDDTSDVPAKRANVFRRALQGLSTKSTSDLSRIEDMLVQLLKEMEELKLQSGMSTDGRPPVRSLNSYEHLRSIPDPGYEPSGRAGTSSSPTQSGYISIPSSKHLNTMYSGYDINRGSGEHRISTVLEDDEDVEEPRASLSRTVRYADEQAGTTSARYPLIQTPPLQTDQPQSLDPTPKTDKSRSKYKSGSSIFGGMAKISRWSKTTASSIADNPQSMSRSKGRPTSSDSRSGANADFDFDYELDDEAAKSQASLESQRARLNQSQVRSQSPLVPEHENEHDHEHDDPKYHVHRNSQNLQHPQPRPGPTHRHQSNLENQAISLSQARTPVADQWGSIPALALNRNRFSTGSPQQLSPVQSEDMDSRSSTSEGVTPYQGSARYADDGPLIPAQSSNASNAGQYEMYGVPMSSGMHIASPLEPIEEVRKSLETDRSSVRPESTPSPHPIAMRSNQRKITGPREMPRSASASSRRRHGAAASSSPG